MGGIKTDKHMRVINKNTDVPFIGLYAVGEVVGGLHGKNRLGGNALTECVVFGLQVANEIDLSPKTSQVTKTPARVEQPELNTIPSSELSIHRSSESCWVHLGDKIYDLTEFLEEHPAGPESILSLCGRDGSENFEEVHSYELLKNYNFKPIGLAEILSR